MMNWSEYEKGESGDRVKFTSGGTYTTPLGTTRVNVRPGSGGGGGGGGGGQPEMKKPRPIMLPLLFWLATILLLIFILAGLSGCAEDRWLTKEEDAEMRANCEPHGGCAIVPYPMWEHIKRALGMVGV